MAIYPFFDKNASIYGWCVVGPAYGGATGVPPCGEQALDAEETCVCEADAPRSIPTMLGFRVWCLERGGLWDVYSSVKWLGFSA